MLASSDPVGVKLGVCGVKLVSWLNNFSNRICPVGYWLPIRTTLRDAFHVVVSEFL